MSVSFSVVKISAIDGVGPEFFNTYSQLRKATWSSGNENNLKLHAEKHIDIPILACIDDIVIGAVA